METGSHAFVVRIWAEEGARGVWRGHVTHVTTGTHRYFVDLREMVDFIRPFVLELGTGAAGGDGTE